MPTFDPDSYLSNAQQQPQEEATFDPNQYLGTPRTTVEKLGRQVGLTARGAYEGFVSPATTVLEGVRGLYNLFAPEKMQMPSFHEAQKRTLTSLGLPEAETTAERAAQAGVQAMTGTGVLSGIAQKVTPAATALTENLLGQTVSAGVGATAGQPTAEAVKDYTGSDLAAMLAGIGVSGMVGGATSKGVNSLLDRANKAPTMTMDQVKQRAQQKYTEVSDLGVKLSKNNAMSMVDDISNNLENQGFLISKEVNPSANGVIEKLRKSIEDGKTSLEDISQLRTMINTTLRGSSDATLRKIGSNMVSDIDNHLANLKPDPMNFASGIQNLDDAMKALASARKDWRNMSRASMLENILNIADAKALDPKASESELIRRGFVNLAANQNKMKLFSEQERNAIRAVANGGAVDSLLSFIGQFNPERSKMAAIATAGGAAAKPEVAIPLALTGMAADKLQGVLRRGAAEKTISGMLSGNLPPIRPDMTTGGLLGGTLGISP